MFKKFNDWLLQIAKDHTKEIIKYQLVKYNIEEADKISKTIDELESLDEVKSFQKSFEELALNDSELYEAIRNSKNEIKKNIEKDIDILNRLIEELKENNLIIKEFNLSEIKTKRLKELSKTDSIITLIAIKKEIKKDFDEIAKYLNFMDAIIHSDDMEADEQTVN